MISKNAKGQRKLSKRALLATAFLSLFLLGKNVNADEISEVKKPATASILEQKASAQNIDISLNYKVGNREDVVDYGKSYYTYLNGRLLGNSSNNAFPEFAFSEKRDIEDIVSGVKYGFIIDSYASLTTEVSKSFSGNQKLALLAVVSNLLYRGAYNNNHPTNEVYSQDVFFTELQDFLRTGHQQNLGVCRHISTHVEKLARDLGLTAASVTGYDGGGHVYPVIKTKDGETAIVDRGNIILANTKNIEKIIETYQRDNNSLIFDHYFFEDSKFKYRLLTENGKNFLDFIGYDESVNTLKDALTSIKDSHNSNIKLTFNKTDSEISAETDFLGIFAKFGKFYGNSSLPIEDSLFQVGYKNKFLKSGLYLNPEMSWIFGSDTYSKEKQFGITGNFVGSTNNKEGVNLAARVSGNFLMINRSQESEIISEFILYDTQFQFGASCKIPIRNFTIEPHFISKFNFFPQDIGAYNHAPVLSEINGGIIFGANVNNTAFSLNPYYANRIWEQEFGANVKIGGKNLEFSAGGYLTKSDYEFCPNKYGFNIGSNLNLKNLRLGVDYEIEGTNYDGEISNKSSLSIQGKIKF